MVSEGVFGAPGRRRWVAAGGRAAVPVACLPADAIVNCGFEEWHGHNLLLPKPSLSPSATPASTGGEADRHPSPKDCSPPQQPHSRYMTIPPARLVLVAAIVVCLVAPQARCSGHIRR